MSVSAALFLLLTLTPPAAGLQDPLDEARRLWAEGRYSEALERTADILDPGQRAFERLEVRYHAGDLGGALREALAGLRVAPDDRMLLWRATRLAIDLLATERAVLFSERLAAVVLAAQDLEPADREAWVRSAADLAAEAAGLERTDAARGSALRRARVSVAVVALAVLLAAGWLSIGPRRAVGES